MSNEPDEPDAVQIQMDIQSAVDEAVRNIREHALRQVMVMVNKMKPDEYDEYDEVYSNGFTDALSQICVEIEAMIANDIASDAIDGGRFAKIADANSDEQ